MPYETITIETPDNEKLHGFLIKQTDRTNERETLIFFHGNAGNIGHRYDDRQLRTFSLRVESEQIRSIITGR